MTHEQIFSGLKVYTLIYFLEMIAIFLTTQKHSLY